MRLNSGSLGAGPPIEYLPPVPSVSTEPEVLHERVAAQLGNPSRMRKMRAVGWVLVAAVVLWLSPHPSAYVLAAPFVLVALWEASKIPSRRRQHREYLQSVRAGRWFPVEAQLHTATDGVDQLRLSIRTGVPDAPPRTLTVSVLEPAWDPSVLVNTAQHGYALLQEDNDAWAILVLDDRVLFSEAASPEVLYPEYRRA